MQIVNQSQSVGADRGAHEAAWSLPGHTALVLSAAPIERRLTLNEGVLWITRTRESCPVARAAAGAGAIDLPAAWGDHWLTPGEHLRLPAHAEFVLEAGPTARFGVQEVPPAPWRATPAPGRAQAGRLTGALRRVVGGLAGLAPRARGWA